MVTNPNQEIFFGAFHNDLKVGHFNESLAQKAATLTGEIVARVKCYIKGEESNTKKRTCDARGGGKYEVHD